VHPGIFFAATAHRNVGTHHRNFLAESGVVTLPNVDISTVFCLLLYQIIGALLMNVANDELHGFPHDQHQQNNE
jgi:hypothetical protein